ncbi:MAG TPA: ankyrin repeat domain-containing protein [Vicinamibacterales bacterium]|nr:ankyrin repeat domain-containing protein [Vicinamibacterales bacterium]
MTVRPTHPPTRVMRENPDIDQLRRQARELLEAYRAQSPDAVLEVEAYCRTATPATFALHDAQFVLARSYGFESWPKLKAGVEGVTTKRLHDTVKKGDLEAVRALLARRPEIVDLLPGGPSGSEIRALHIAVMARDVEMTRLLLEAGADTRDGIWPNRDATGPRTIAEERGYDEIVALMTAHEEKRGARVVNALDDGVRRLRDAMMTGGEGAVIAVLESEPALAGMCPPDGVTMLHRAAQYGLLRVAKWLLDHGADVNKPSQPDFWRWKGRTPLEFAVWEFAADSHRSAREAMAALLIERGAELTLLPAAALGRWDYLASRPLESLQGTAVLQAAVRGDRPDVLRRLLERGLDPNEQIQLGQIEEQTFSSGGPLLEAVNTGRIDMARLLLAYGADPNASVYTAGSAIGAAYNGGSPRTHAPDQAMIDLMVEHGGWIDAGSVGYMGNVDLAGRMLQGEVDPHLESGTVEEALLWGGASGRRVEIVRMALERIGWPRDDIRWFWILWRPLPGHRDLTEAEQADSCATFRRILERCDPNLRSTDSGQTMLHEVIARDHGVGVALATMLLDAGARTDIRDEFLKSTPLGWACRWGRVALVELLLARGADPIEAGAEPWATPLAWAERRHHAGITSILLQHRAGR